MMDTWIQGLLGWQTTPKHVIKFTKGPVPEIFHTCKKKMVFCNLNTYTEMPAVKKKRRP
jgi:hypothetical protein